MHVWGDCEGEIEGRVYQVVCCIPLPSHPAPKHEPSGGTRGGEAPLPAKHFQQSTVSVGVPQLELCVPLPLPCSKAQAVSVGWVVGQSGWGSICVVGYMCTHVDLHVPV